MFFYSATEYAVRGLSELVARAPSGRIILEELVAGTDLPYKSLGPIFHKLARAGLLVSAKGPGGGFTLARPSHTITLRDVFEAIEGVAPLQRCVVGLKQCDDEALCPLHDLYKPIRQRLANYLETTTLADLGASLRSKPAWRAASDERAAAPAFPAAPSAPAAPPVPRSAASAAGGINKKSNAFATRKGKGR